MTMSSSKSRRSTKSSIGNVPYDVLLEIFIHCLPKDRFNFLQPNTRNAPILLCHICSSWRTVALTSPTLWSHLSYSLMVNETEEELGGWAFLPNDIEFILWWKKNQGSIAPFLRLHIDIDDEDPRRLIGGDGMTFIMKYVTTAQHLEINPIFWERVEVLFETGGQITFPNLHTLVHMADYAIMNLFYPMQVLIGRVLNPTPSILRRLAIVSDETPSISPTIPAHWSTLTHLSIDTFRLSLHFWVPLTSALSHLQWVYIAFDHLLHVHEYMNPIERTLPQLSTLLIKSDDNIELLPSSLFKNLYLPVLSNLMLSCRRVKKWWDHRGITDLYTVLQSTPAIRKLTLRKHVHLSSAEIDYSSGTLAAIGGVPCIWSRAPYLVHLQFELFITCDCSKIEAAKELDIFACSSFLSNNRWLDLDTSGCPIKTITVVVYGRRFKSYVHFDINTYLKTSSNRKSAGNGSDIALHVISEPYTDLANSWKEWRSGN